MIRRLTSIAAVGSLLLCAATCVLWVRSLSVSEIWWADGGYVDFGSGRGGLVVTVDPGAWTFEGDQTGHLIFDADPVVDAGSHWHRIGATRSGTLNGLKLYCPHWLAAVALAAPPVVLWLRARRRRRVEHRGFRVDPG